MDTDVDALATQPKLTVERGIVWDATEGQVGNIGYYFLCALFCWLVVPLLMMLWRYLVTSYHRYELTTERLREQVGVINRRTNELELYRVKDIQVNEPLFERMFGRGTVVLETSDRTCASVLLKCVPEPRAVANMLRQHVERCRTAKGVREID